MQVDISTFEIGETLDSLEFGPITRTDIVRYQGASGDMNPIHHDEPFALASGYPAPLTVGMLPVGIINSWIAAKLGPENIRRTRCRWKRPVFPGDKLRCDAIVQQKRETDNGETQLDLEMRCINQDDVVTSIVWCTFLLPKS